MGLWKKKKKKELQNVEKTSDKTVQVQTSMSLDLTFYYWVLYIILTEALEIPLSSILQWFRHMGGDQHIHSETDD